MNEARLAVERAIDKLINRFGKQSDVIGELRAALNALDKAEVPASAKVKEPEGIPAPEPPTEEAETEDAEPPRKPSALRVYGGRKK